MPNNIITDKILVVGAGTIAQEYAKILRDLGCTFTVVGRSLENTQRFQAETGVPAIHGGVEHFLSKHAGEFSTGIIAVGVDSLAGTSEILMAAGIKNILCEKPGGLNLEQISRVSHVANTNSANVFLAYNRRFYASVLKARDIIAQDGGIASFNFEFTEWGHQIENLPIPDAIRQQWFLANSSHVVNLAFYLGGTPIELTSFVAGELSWHKPASFAGAGKSAKDVLFSYHANWGAPGRWGVEVLTKEHRLILRPLEKLQIQKKGSVGINFVEIDDTLDVKYKPGFYQQLTAFLERKYANFHSIFEQEEAMKTYYRKMLSGLN